MDNNPAQGELEVFRGFRWWGIDEIAASCALFAPNQLAVLLRQLLNSSDQDWPVQVGT